MPDLDLSEGRRLLEAATGVGDWSLEIDRDDDQGYEFPNWIVGPTPHGPFGPKIGEIADFRPDDAAVIVWAINHLPALLDTAEKMTALEKFARAAMRGRLMAEGIPESDADAEVERRVASILRGDQTP